MNQGHMCMYRHYTYIILKAHLWKIAKIFKSFSKNVEWKCADVSQIVVIRQGYILTNLINMSVKLFSTVSIVFFPVDFKSARYHSRFCIFN